MATDLFARVQENAWKETMFRSILKFELLRKRHTLAVPEPDLGNDLWFSRLDGDRALVRAQLKSAYAGRPYTRGMIRYLVNVKIPVFEDSLSHGSVYFIGLYDEKEHRQCHNV